MRAPLGFALALLVAGTAEASTVAVEPSASGAAVLVVRAAPGEANRLVFGTDLFPTPAVEVSDAVTLTPGAGCQPATAPGGGSRLRCSPEIAGIVVSAGDGDDEVGGALTGMPLTVDGGAGNDRLSGMGPSTLYGGDGDDELTGSGAADALYSGPGRDYLAAGAGDDLLDASDSGGAVMEAGHGNDVLVGGPGDDQLEADGGADTLTGGPGTDGYTAGSGDDVLRTRDGVSEEIGCGSGRDEIDHDLTDYPSVRRLVSAREAISRGRTRSCSGSTGRCDRHRSGFRVIAGFASTSSVRAPIASVGFGSCDF